MLNMILMTVELEVKGLDVAGQMGFSSERCWGMFPDHNI